MNELEESIKSINAYTQTVNELHGYIMRLCAALDRLASFTQEFREERDLLRDELKRRDDEAARMRELAATRPPKPCPTLPCTQCGGVLGNVTFFHGLFQRYSQPCKVRCHSCDVMHTLTLERGEVVAAPVS